MDNIYYFVAYFLCFPAVLCLLIFPFMSRLHRVLGVSYYSPPLSAHSFGLCSTDVTGPQGPCALRPRRRPRTVAGSPRPGEVMRRVTYGDHADTMSRPLCSCDPHQCHAGCVGDGSTREVTAGLRGPCCCWAWPHQHAPPAAAAPWPEGSLGLPALAERGLQIRAGEKRGAACRGHPEPSCGGPGGRPEEEQRRRFPGPPTRRPPPGPRPGAAVRLTGPVCGGWGEGRSPSVATRSGRPVACSIWFLLL